MAGKGRNQDAPRRSDRRGQGHLELRPYRRPYGPVRDHPGKVLAGEDIPFGKKGIYFSETGEYTWRWLAEVIGKAGAELGALDSVEPKSISLEEGAQRWVGGNAGLTELALASNARTRAKLSREIGWKPVKTQADFERTIKEEFSLLLESA